MSIWLNNILCLTAVNFSNTESLRFYPHHENNAAYRGAAYSYLQLVLLNLHTEKLSNPLRNYQHKIRKELVYKKIISNALLRNIRRQLQMIMK